jgi:hypothetical protein
MCPATVVDAAEPPPLAAVAVAPALPRIKAAKDLIFRG